MLSSGSSVSSVDSSALVDLEVVKSIVNEISEEENDAFRAVFETWFNNPEESYTFSKKDKFAEMKAFMIIVALASMNVEETGNESLELLAFVKAFVRDDFFSEAYHGMAAILFGIAASEVSGRKSGERIFFVCLFHCLTLVCNSENFQTGRCEKEHKKSEEFSEYFFEEKTHRPNSRCSSLPADFVHPSFLSGGSIRFFSEIRGNEK